jgi:hypothetical protein
MNSKKNKVEEEIVITYPQQDVDEFLINRFFSLLDLEELSDLRNLFLFDEIKHLNTRCTDTIIEYNTERIFNKGAYLHLTFDENERSHYSFYSCQQLLDSYCAEEEIFGTTDRFELFHQQNPHGGTRCKIQSFQKLRIVFKSKLFLVYVKYVVSPVSNNRGSTLTPCKVSILDSFLLTDSEGKKLVLVGFIVFQGVSGNGHFIAYVLDRDHQTLQWVCFDDLQGVSVVLDPDKVFSRRNLGLPCLFLYGEDNEDHSIEHYLNDIKQSRRDNNPFKKQREGK